MPAAYNNTIIYYLVLMSYYIFEKLDYFNKNCSLLDLDYVSPQASCFLTKIIEQIKPIKVYNNLEEDRLQLYKEQRNKTGVYCLVN